MTQLSILVVGGGIAGLSAAIGLRRRGHTVTVFERHAECQTLGAPVNLRPNATHVLIEYGMEQMMSEMDTLAGSVFCWQRYANGKYLQKHRLTDMVPQFGAP